MSYDSDAAHNASQNASRNLRYRSLLTTDHWPLATALRRDLPHHALLVGPAAGGRAVEVAVRVNRDAAHGFASIVEIKLMKEGEGPAASRRREFEDLSGVISTQTKSRAVQISRAVSGNTGQWPILFDVTDKPVNQGIVPSAARGAKLEDCAASVWASELGGGVEIACGIKDGRALGENAC